MPGDQGRRRMRVKGSEAGAGDGRRGTGRRPGVGGRGGAGLRLAPSLAQALPGREENRPKEPLGGRSGIRGGRTVWAATRPRAPPSPGACCAHVLSAGALGRGPSSSGAPLLLAAHVGGPMAC